MNIALLDIGGTSIKSLVYETQSGFDSSLVRETPTSAKQGGEAMMRQAEELLDKEKGFSAISISTAGQVNPHSGSIVFATDNMPGYTGMAVKGRFEQRFQVPVFVENDVNAAAIGEAAFGAAKGLSDFACLTFGTGIGGALFIKGHLYHGSSFSAAEAGHLVTHLGGLPCTCGSRGCWEQYASTSALVNLVREKTGLELNGRQIFNAMPDNSHIQELISRWIEEISAGLASIIQMLNPQALILGGGVMEQSSLIEAIRRETLSHVMPSYRQTRILQASLGNSAGLMGMLHLAQEGLGIQSA